MVAVRALLLSLPLFLWAVGADVADPSDGEAQHESPNELMNPELSELARGNDNFAFDLYAELSRANSENFFFSPSSVRAALAMTYAGARGETESQMAMVLHFTVPQERLHQAFGEFIEVLTGREKGYRLSLANRLWGQQGYDYLPDFLRITRKHYGAELALLDFMRHHAEARQSINSWVEKQTEGQIRDLIPDGVLDRRTRLVLTNAIFFKGSWTHAFEEQATTEAPFLISATEETPAQLMFLAGSFSHHNSDGIQVLELPYGEGALSMIVLLPEKVDGLWDIESKLNPENYRKWMSELQPEQLQVYLPKFRVTAQFRLDKVLVSMGMPLAFDRSRADFSAISGRKDLYLSAVLHKAFVDVNEEGTEAAAGSGAVLNVRSMREPIVFRADHPFVFLIRENQTGSILFLGRVVNPSG